MYSAAHSDGNKWVTNAVVRNIPNIDNFESLNVGRTSITDESLIDISSMCHLNNLCLDCNKLTGTALKKLARALKGIKKLSLWGLDGEMNSGSISDHDLEFISKELTSLTHLSIRKSFSI